VRATFHQELQELEESLADECELVVRALRGALGALEAADVELAEEVIGFDDTIDERYVWIQEGIERLLARQTPVAADLRLVLGMLHVNLHLERAADYCVTIAKLVKLTRALEGDPTLIEGLEAMGARAEEMLTLAVSSFRDRDLARAERLVLMDEEIDTANRRLVHDVLALGTDEERREWGLRMILVSRCLERIGDHAVDIGEQTAYLVTGEFREFTDASHPDSSANGRPPAEL
jgi:phosphate transport system protein